jgi:hypothetical protein
MFADGFGPLADLFRKIWAIAALSVLFGSVIGAAVGSRAFKAAWHKPLSVLCGCLVGTAAGSITGWVLLRYFDFIGGLLVAPIVAGAIGYFGARGFSMWAIHKWGPWPMLEDQHHGSEAGLSSQEEEMPS